VTQQPAKEQGGATRGGGMDMPANKRWCHNKRHEVEMKVADTMAKTEEDAASIGTVKAEWEDEDDETG
jgi:hypothetical protein